MAELPVVEVESGSFLILPKPAQPMTGDGPEAVGPLLASERRKAVVQLPI